MIKPKGLPEFMPHQTSANIRVYSYKVFLTDLGSHDSCHPASSSCYLTMSWTSARSKERNRTYSFRCKAFRANHPSSCTKLFCYYWIVRMIFHFFLSFFAIFLSLQVKIPLFQIFCGHPYIPDAFISKESIPSSETARSKGAHVFKLNRYFQIVSPKRL